jgi:hypothetical protein
MEAMKSASILTAPACLACDDCGVVTGNSVLQTAFCRCPTGQTLRTPGAESDPINDLAVMIAAHEPLGSIVSLPPMKQQFVFGAICIDEAGMTYAGARIEDAGRAYRSLMAVLHGQEPNPDDRPPRFPSKDLAVQDLGLMVARLAHALALHSPNDHMLRSATTILTRHGMQSGVDYKALPELPKIAWPTPEKVAFNTDRREDPHNMSNRHNALNQGRRRSDRQD